MYRGSEDRVTLESQLPGLFEEIEPEDTLNGAAQQEKSALTGSLLKTMQEHGLLELGQLKDILDVRLVHWSGAGMAI
jgi:hypothetical protein